MATGSKNDGGSSPTHRLGCLALVVALCGMLDSPALAEDLVPGRDQFSGFIEAAPHVVVQRARGSVGTNFDFSARKSNILTNLTFRLGGGVKGPAIESWWGRPRPVVYAGALIPINESSTIGAELTNSSGGGFDRVKGKKFAIEYQTSGVAGLGMEFTVPILDFELGITPAIESLHLVSRYTGEGSLLIQSQSPGIPSESHDVRTKKEITQHFLGPAIRLSTPTTAVRGVFIDLFLSTSLLFDVAGTHERIPVDGENGDQAEFNFETGSGAVQVSTGFQLRWP